MSETNNRTAGGPGERLFRLIQGIEGRYWTTVFFLALFGYTLLLVVEALGYSGPARLFPLVVGVPLLGLIVVKVAVTLFGDRLGIRSVDLFEDIQDLDSGDEELDAAAERQQYRRELETALWVAFAIVTIALFGHLFGLVIFVFGFVYAYERDLLRAGVATAVTFLFVYILFKAILGASLHEGLLISFGGVFG